MTIWQRSCRRMLSEDSEHPVPRNSAPWNHRKHKIHLSIIIDETVLPSLQDTTDLFFVTTIMIAYNDIKSTTKRHQYNFAAWIKQ